MSQFDYDWIVVGSGFGGSVSALRLAEKGYSVGVLECGKRFRDEDFPKSTWDLRRYFWAPRLGLRGIFRLTLFKDVSVVSGCGVGGGSLGYANTLYVPAHASSSRTRSGRDLDGLGADARPPLRRGAADARRRRVHDSDDPADQLLRELGEHLGVGDTYQQDPRRGLPRRARARPSPTPTSTARARTAPAACVRPLHGRLPARRQEHAGQELPLVRREAAASRSSPDRTVTEIRPLGAADGSDGYAITSERSGLLAPAAARSTLTRARRRRRRRRRSAPTSCCSAAGSAARCRGSPTGSASWSAPTARSILAVTVPDDYPDDLSRRVAITSEHLPRPRTPTSRPSPTARPATR